MAAAQINVGKCLDRKYVLSSHCRKSPLVTIIGDSHALAFVLSRAFAKFWSLGRAVTTQSFGFLQVSVLPLCLGIQAFFQLTELPFYMYCLRSFK